VLAVLWKGGTTGLKIDDVSARSYASRPLHHNNGALHDIPGSAGCQEKPGQQDDQHRRDDPFDKTKSPLPLGEREGLKTNPELKTRQTPTPRPIEATTEARKTPHEKRDERLEAQSVPNSVFGQDRVTLSPEAQVVTPVHRKAEAVGVKRMRQKYLPPGLNGLAARANPAPRFEEFLDAFQSNFS
jgi:hypothetical protein